MLSNTKETSSKVCRFGLGEGANEIEIAEIFSNYGPLNQVYVSNRPPWKALVFFKDNKQALEAVRCLNRTLVLLFIIIVNIIGLAHNRL